MKKIFSIAFLCVFFGCEGPRADQIETPDQISQHPAFVELMSTYQEVFSRFNLLSGPTVAEKQAYHQGLKSLIDSKAAVDELAPYLGYSSSEFTSFGTKVRKSMGTLLTTFPGLNNFDDRGRFIFIEAMKMYVFRTSESNERNSSFGRTNVEEPSGCAAGRFVSVKQSIAITRLSLILQ